MHIDRKSGDAIRQNVSTAIAEDLGSGDLTAALLKSSATARAGVVCRDRAIIAGQPWFDEVFRQIDATVNVHWHISDGEIAERDTVLCEIEGTSGSLLAAERTALNFLQMMSATATVTAEYVKAVAGTGAVILDTRKTIPGLRLAQKYAVRCGGGQNHRVGLYDAILIKENHIAAAGGIETILQQAMANNPGVLIEIEVESLADLRVALEAGARRIMLDNLSLADTAQAVRINREEFGGHAQIESSGGKSLKEIRQTAETGVDFISVGALTKNVQAVDLTMLIDL